MTLILPTGLGFLLGQIFIPQPDRTENVDENTDQDTADDASDKDSLPTAA